MSEIELALPKCEKCGKQALGLVHKVWLCGDHMIEFEKKINAQAKKMILEE